MEKQNIVQLLDQNCQELVNELEQSVNLQFVKVENNYDSAQVTERSQGGLPTKITIYYAEPLSCPGIYHELLHAKCAILLGDNRCILENEPHCFADKLFDYNNCQRMVNHVEHVIMYPIFLQKGYDPNLFFKGINYSADDIDKLLQMDLKSPTGIYYTYMVENFIVAVMSFMFFPIDNRFKVYLKDLKRKEPDLFRIIKKFYTEISTIHIKKEDYEKIQLCYCQYKSAIIVWAANHKFM